MSEQEGSVFAEAENHILKITISNTRKKNAFHPEMMLQLSNALTTLHNDPELWVGVIAAEGDDFTSGLDMPKFFGPNANPTPIPDTNIDAFGLRNVCSKPIVTAVQGICYTVGIEMALAGDIIVAAEDSRFCQMEAKRGIAPLGGTHFRYVARSGWGNAMYHLLLCDEFGAAEVHRVGIRNRVMNSQDAEEGIRSFVERRQANFTGR